MVSSPPASPTIQTLAKTPPSSPSLAPATSSKLAYTPPEHDDAISKQDREKILDASAKAMAFIQVITVADTDGTVRIIEWEHIREDYVKMVVDTYKKYTSTEGHTSIRAAQLLAGELKEELNGLATNHLKGEKKSYSDTQYTLWYAIASLQSKANKLDQFPTEDKSVKDRAEEDKNHPEHPDHPSQQKLKKKKKKKNGKKSKKDKKGKTEQNDQQSLAGEVDSADAGLKGGNPDGDDGTDSDDAKKGKSDVDDQEKEAKAEVVWSPKHPARSEEELN